MKAINSLIFACGSPLNAPPYIECGDPLSCQDAVELERNGLLSCWRGSTIASPPDPTPHCFKYYHASLPDTRQPRYHFHIPSSRGIIPALNTSKLLDRHISRSHPSLLFRSHGLASIPPPARSLYPRNQNTYAFPIKIIPDDEIEATRSCSSSACKEASGSFPGRVSTFRDVA